MTVRFDARDPLLARILGRTRSLFDDDIKTYSSNLTTAITDRKLLIVGAAGSIGSAFVKEVAVRAPSAIHLVDINENGLVELVRDLRSGTFSGELRTVSVDFTGLEFTRFAADNAPYDIFANFSALKHVRAERDVYSLLRMVEVNVAALDRCLAAMLGFTRVFSVSTDKSVRPANLMGATKNLMERVLFSRPGKFTATSARFANVAFSAGSLLEGFENRLAKGQPISAPNDVRRYFISCEEAAQLCLLACFLGWNREVFFPKLSNKHMMGFPDIASMLLTERGLEAHLCSSEEKARREAPPPGTWPCYFSPSDTSGEKPEEEFYRPGDERDLNSFQAAGIVREGVAQRQTIDTFLSTIEAIRAESVWSKESVVAAIRSAVPELEHIERHKNLDQKM